VNVPFEKKAQKNFQKDFFYIEEEKKESCYYYYYSYIKSFMKKEKIYCHFFCSRVCDFNIINVL